METASSGEEPNRAEGEHRGESEEEEGAPPDFCNDGDNPDDNSATAATAPTASTGQEPEQDCTLPPAAAEGGNRDGDVHRHNSALQARQVDDGDGADGRTEGRLESATSFETVTDESCSATPVEPASTARDDENDGSCRGGSPPQAKNSEERAEESQSKEGQHVPPEHATSPQAPPLPNRPSPSSLKKRGSTDGTEFGEFVSRPDEEAWNPFDGGDISPTEFCIDEDDEPPSAALAIKRKASTSSQSKQDELDSLRRVFDSEYERALEDQDISWKARYGATRLSFLVSALMMVAYLWLGCMFYSSEADWSIPDALLFTVYTVTTVGYGGPQPLPNTAAFHAFTSFYVIAGISLVTVLGAHTYQLVTLEATRIRANPRRKRRQSAQDIASDGFQEEEENVNSYREQFMNELEDFTKQQPFLEALIARLKSFRTYLRTTKSGQVLAVVLPFVGMILLGALVVGTIEEWTPLESIYWSIVTLTTVGYGDYVPTKNSSVWFCTLFFIPTSLFFLSFLLAHVAKTYIRLHAIHVARLEKNMRRKNERRRMEADRAEKARRNAKAAVGDDHDTSSTEQSAQSNESTSNIDSMEGGFTTMFTTEDDDAHGSPTKRTGLFGDQTGNLEEGSTHSNQFASDTSPGARYREHIIRNKVRVIVNLCAQYFTDIRYSASLAQHFDSLRLPIPTVDEWSLLPRRSSH